MFAYNLTIKSGHFGLRKDIVKNPIFRVKQWIERFLPIFAYIYKGCQVESHRVFHPSKNLK
jgi:hypothetical protein